MRLDQLVRVKYQIRFESKWIPYSGFFAGLGIFLLCVMFFGLNDFTELGTSGLVMSLVLPLVLLAGYGILLRGFKVKTVPVYGILGALYCLIMIIRAASYGGAGSTLLAVIWYIISGVVVLAVTLGILPGRVFIVAALLLPVLYRLIFVDIDFYLKQKDYVGFLPEAAALCGLLAFSFFGLCLKSAAKDDK